MNRHFSEAEVAEALRDLEAGVRLPEVCRRHGVSELTLIRWRRRAGLPARSSAPVPTAPLDPEQATLRIAGLEQRLDAFRHVLVAMLPPPELERAARVLQAKLSVSSRRARSMVGLRPGSGMPSRAAGTAGA